MSSVAVAAEGLDYTERLKALAGLIEDTLSPLAVDGLLVSAFYPFNSPILFVQNNIFIYFFTQ